MSLNFAHIGAKTSIDSNSGLAPNRQLAIIWNNAGLVYWCIYAPLRLNELTHWGRDKMAVILAEVIFKCIFLNEKVQILIKISLKFVPKGLIYNNQALV